MFLCCEKRDVINSDVTVWFLTSQEESLQLFNLIGSQARRRNVKHRQEREVQRNNCWQWQQKRNLQDRIVYLSKVTTLTKTVSLHLLHHLTKTWPYKLKHRDRQVSPLSSDEKRHDFHIAWKNGNCAWTEQQLSFSSAPWTRTKPLETSCQTQRKIGQPEFFIFRVLRRTKAKHWQKGVSPFQYGFRPFSLSPNLMLLCQYLAPPPPHLTLAKKHKTAPQKPIYNLLFIE